MSLRTALAYFDKPASTWPGQNPEAEKIEAEIRNATDGEGWRSEIYEIQKSVDWHRFDEAMSLTKALIQTLLNLERQVRHLQRLKSQP